jgi:hypothetical protein
VADRGALCAETEQFVPFAIAAPRLCGGAENFSDKT